MLGGVSGHRLERGPERATASGASRKPLRLARFPPGQHGNLYYQLLYSALRKYGVELVAEPNLSFSWLWRARKDVTSFISTGVPTGTTPGDSPSRIPIFVRHGGRTSARGFDWADPRRHGSHRVLGFHVVWTIHEVFLPRRRQGRRVRSAAGSTVSAGGSSPAGAGFCSATTRPPPSELVSSSAALRPASRSCRTGPTWTSTRRVARARTSGGRSGSARMRSPSSASVRCARTRRSTTSSTPSARSTIRVLCSSSQGRSRRWLTPAGAGVRGRGRADQATSRVHSR